MDTAKQIERIQYILETIEPGKVTLLTGSNGSGKSLVRKQLCFRLERKLPGTDYRRLTADVSMQRRTSANPNLGALSTVMQDDKDQPTSYSTYYLVKMLMGTFLKEDNSSKRYLIIDEPEIGMSKESQLGFVTYLKERIPDILKYTYGLLIITHSEMIVNALKDEAVFLNMDKDCTADEWINREIIPTDFEKLENDSYELFQAINNYSKE
jgi:predicted ATPase